MPFAIFLELFGYIGTALVILSMLMTSVVKLRVFNICGSVISMIYALVGRSWPIVVLNAALVTINILQLIRMHRVKVTFSHVQATVTDPCVTYFLQHHADDIKKYFPDYSVKRDPDAEVHIVYCGSEMVGILIGRREGDHLHIDIDYATRRYRDLSVSTFLYACLKESGITMLSASESVDYLVKMGFQGEGVMTKQL